MDNWLLIIVGVIFLISIVAGYVRGLLKIGISLLATVLSIVLVMFLAPYVSDALIKWTPADEMIEEKCMEMFMPQISADTLKNADLSGTSLGELNQDQLADIRGKSRLQYLNGLAPEDHGNAYVTWERQAGAFIINTDVLKKHKLSEPKTYEDLLDRKYYNLIAMPDPKSSGTGYFFYKNLVNTMGEAKALAYIDQLEFNVKQFTESGSGPIKLLIQGEVGIGLGLTFQAVNQINTGSPFKIIYPKEGSPYSLTGTGLMKRHADDPDVQRVFDFIINDFLLYDKETS